MTQIYTKHVDAVNMKRVHTICDYQLMDSMGKRLRRAREKLYSSARQAALRMGVPYSTYAAHENGQNDFGEAEAKQYGKAFKVSPGSLLTGVGDAGRASLVPAVGYVGAGAEVVPIDDHPQGGGIEEVELAPGAPSGAVAVIVRGDSMYPRYYGGETLFYYRDQTPPGELIGRECVVGLRDGRMMVKTLRRGSKRNRYHLESFNAPLLEDQDVEWAAPVRWTARG